MADDRVREVEAPEKKSKSGAYLFLGIIVLIVVLGVGYYFGRKVSGAK